MPRYNVKYKDKWATFTSVADGFLTHFADEATHDQWRLLEYGRADFTPVSQGRCNLMTIEDAVFSMVLNRSGRRSKIAKECILELVELGIEKGDAEELVKTALEKREED
jgi:hypothetical protein